MPLARSLGAKLAKSSAAFHNAEEMGDTLEAIVEDTQ